MATAPCKVSAFSPQPATAWPGGLLASRPCDPYRAGPFRLYDLMSQIPVPAPLWRRLLAGVYDLLLILGLWMIAAWVMVVIASLSGLELDRRVNQIVLFLVGMGFYAGFWSRAGQTLGMRVWRLHVRRSDGAPPRWPIAVLRYCAAWFSLLALGLGMLWSLIDRQRRCWHDLVAGTEVIQMPKPAPGKKTE